MATLLQHPTLREFFAGFHLLAVRAAPQVQACATCNGQRRTFACPKWPVCGCPEGSIDPACPGKSVACSCPSGGALGSC